MENLTSEQREAVKPTIAMFKNRYRNPKHPWYANNSLIEVYRSMDNLLQYFHTILAEEK